MGNLGTPYRHTVHLRFIGKLIMNLLFVIIERFSLGVAYEAIPANNDWKSTFLKGVGQFQSNFHVEGDVPANHFARLDRPVNPLQFCR